MLRFADKTMFISGGSRGIGKAIALRLAQAGANIVITGKSEAPHPKLPGTIHSAAADIEAAGGHALAVPCDIRSQPEIGVEIYASPSDLAIMERSRRSDHASSGVHSGL
jgi:citronellol/citronellal dehydrogenase